MARVKIKASEVLAEHPLEWDVFDQDGSLLYAKGVALDAQAKHRLLARGALRELDADAGKPLAAKDSRIAAQEGKTENRLRMQLSETAVRPGDMVSLDRGVDGSRVTAQIVGYLKNRSIIITIPADEQGPVYLKEGESVVAKIFSGRHVLVFPCTTLTVASKPYPHIHLSYPSDVSGVAVRRFDRVAVRIVAAIDIGQEQVSGIITDLSVGGLSFATRAAHLETGTFLHVNFKLDLAGCHYIMRLACQVRASRGQSEVLAGAQAYGAQFCDVAPEDMLILGLFVSQQLADTGKARLE